MESLSHIRLLTEPVVPEREVEENKKHVDQFSPEQVRILKTSKFMAQGNLDLLGPQKDALNKLAGDKLAIRDTPHDGSCWITAANYAFLAHFKDATPDDRAAIIEKVSKVPRTKPRIAYQNILKNIDEFLKQKETLSDDELLLFMNLPENQKMIQAFTCEIAPTAEDAHGYGGPKEIAKFATAIGVKFAHDEINPTREVTKEAGSGDISIDKKTLVFVPGTEGPKNGHYVVLEPKAEDLKVPGVSLSSLVDEAALHQNTFVDALGKQIGIVSNYDDIQALHIQLLEAKRIATSDDEITKINGLLEKIREKSKQILKDEPQPIVGLTLLLKGIKECSKLLDGKDYKPSLEELQKKLELMKFNLKQLESDKKAPEEARQKMVDLSTKIFARINAAKRAAQTWRGNVAQKKVARVEAAAVQFQRVGRGFLDPKSAQSKLHEARQAQLLEDLKNTMRTEESARAGIETEDTEFRATMLQQMQEKIALHQTFEEYFAAGKYFECDELLARASLDLTEQKTMRTRLEAAKKENWQLFPVQTAIEQQAAKSPATALLSPEPLPEASKRRTPYTAADALTSRVPNKSPEIIPASIVQAPEVQAPEVQVVRIEGELSPRSIVTPSPSVRINRREPGGNPKTGNQAFELPTSGPVEAPEFKVVTPTSSDSGLSDSVLESRTPVLLTAPRKTPDAGLSVPLSKLRLSISPEKIEQDAVESTPRELKNNVVNPIKSFELDSRVDSKPKVTQVARRNIVPENLSSVNLEPASHSEFSEHQRNIQEAKDLVTARANDTWKILSKNNQSKENTLFIPDLETLWNTFVATLKDQVASKATIAAVIDYQKEALQSLQTKKTELLNQIEVQKVLLKAQAEEEAINEQDELEECTEQDFDFTPPDMALDSKYLPYILTGAPLEGLQTEAGARFIELCARTNLTENEVVFTAALGNLLLNQESSSETKTAAAKLFHNYLACTDRKTLVAPGVAVDKSKISRRITSGDKLLRSITLPGPVKELFLRLKDPAGLLEIAVVARKTLIGLTQDPYTLHSGQREPILQNKQLNLAKIIGVSAKKFVFRSKPPEINVVTVEFAQAQKLALETGWAKHWPDPKNPPVTLEFLSNLAQSGQFKPEFLNRFPDGGVAVLSDYVYPYMLAQHRIFKGEDPAKSKFFKEPATAAELLSTFKSTEPAEQAAFLVRAMQVMSSDTGLQQNPVSKTQIKMLKAIQSTINPGIRPRPFHAEAGEGKSTMIRLFPELYQIDRLYVLHVSPFPEENHTGYSLNHLPESVSDETPVIPVTIDEFKEWLTKNPKAVLSGLVVLDEYDSHKYTDARLDLSKRGIVPFETSATRNKDDITSQRDRNQAKLDYAQGTFKESALKRWLGENPEKTQDDFIQHLKIKREAKVAYLNGELRKLEEGQKAQFDRAMTLKQSSKINDVLNHAISVETLPGKNSILVEFPEEGDAKAIVNDFKAQIPSGQALIYRDNAGVIHYEIYQDSGWKKFGKEDFNNQTQNMRTYCLYTRDSRGGDFKPHSDKRVGAQILMYKNPPLSDELYQNLRRDRNKPPLAKVTLFLPEPLLKTKEEFVDQAKVLQKTENDKVILLRAKQRTVESVKLDLLNSLLLKTTELKMLDNNVQYMIEAAIREVQISLEGSLVDAIAKAKAQVLEKLNDPWKDPKIARLVEIAKMEKAPNMTDVSSLYRKRWINEKSTLGDVLGVAELYPETAKKIGVKEKELSQFNTALKQEIKTPTAIGNPFEKLPRKSLAQLKGKVLAAEKLNKLLSTVKFIPSERAEYYFRQLSETQSSR